MRIEKQAQPKLCAELAFLMPSQILIGGTDL